MKRLICAAALLMSVLCGCSETAGTEEPVSAETLLPEDTENTETDTTEEIQKEEETTMILKINDKAVETVWENNESVNALKQLASEKTLAIRMSMYGGWEQVGSIGRRLPRNDVQTTAKPGDIMLYSGDQIVLFYGNNSWAYTKLGTMQLTQSELENLLGSGDVTVTITME